MSVIATPLYTPAGSEEGVSFPRALGSICCHLFSSSSVGSHYNCREMDRKVLICIFLMAECLSVGFYCFEETMSRQLL